MFKKCAIKTYTSIVIVALLSMFVPKAVSSAENADQSSSPDPGYCFKLASHIQEEYMLSVAFDESFGPKITSIKLTPSRGQIIEGHVPLRNWVSTITEDYILFEKKSEGSALATVGFVVGIRYDKVVDFVDVQMVQQTSDGTVHTWGGSAETDLPYQRAFRVELPVTPGVDLTEIPMEKSYEPCYNEDYVPQTQQQNKTLVVFLSLAVFALIVCIGYMLLRRALLQ